MIKTKDGTVEFDGRRSEIVGDIYAILEAAYLKTPMELYAAFELFSREDIKRPKPKRSTEEKDARLQALAAVLAAIPEEERERLKEQLLNNKEGRQKADD